MTLTPEQVDEIRVGGHPFSYFIKKFNRDLCTIRRACRGDGPYIKVGTVPPRFDRGFGRKSSLSLTAEQVDTIRLNVEDLTHADYARRFKVSKLTILKACQGEGRYVLIGTIQPRFSPSFLKHLNLTK